MKRISLIVLVLGLCFLTSGCVTAGDILLNDQNIKAGKLINEKATDPEVKQAGIDIVNNSTVLIDALGSAGIDAPAYSTDVSLALREQSNAEHTNLEKVGTGLWDKVSGALPGWLSGAMLALFGLFQTITKKITNKKKTDQVYALVEGIQDIRKSTKDKDYEETIKQILKASQSARNVWPDIKEILDKVKTKS